MKATFYVDGIKLCEDSELDNSWKPPKKPVKERCMGSINNGYIKLPNIVNKEVGEYNFTVAFTGDNVVTTFKGILSKTVIGDNYIEIVSEIKEEKL